MKRLMLLLLLTGTVLSKPMDTPKLSEAVRFPRVVVAEYVDHKSSPPITYFGGTLARYRVVETLRGPLGGEVSVVYAFHDGSACLEEQGWKFSERMMPARGSRWILFLQPEGESWRTYRGDWGRMAATPGNLEKVKAALKG